MIRIKHDSRRKQEYEYAMDVYVNEHTMDAYIDHGWVDSPGGFYQLITINIYINEQVMDAFANENNMDLYIDGSCI